MVLEGADDEARHQHPLGDHQQRPGQAEQDGGDQEAAGGGGVPQQARIDGLHGFGAPAQWPVTAVGMCWTPMRFRNTQ